jgi:hypothetical protein
MPGPPDHSITSRARAVLRRHWIDTRSVTCGSVNGVVYLRGSLHRDPLFPTHRLASVTADDLLHLVHALERDLVTIEGVKDVIVEVEGLARKGDHWERMISPRQQSDD